MAMAARAQARASRTLCTGCCGQGRSVCGRPSAQRAAAVWSETQAPAQVAELRSPIRAARAEVVFVDALLRPASIQQLSASWGGVRVLDRFGLILEIFGANATTKEAHLQLELARCEYERTQLVRSAPCT